MTPTAAITPLTGTAAPAETGINNREQLAKVAKQFEAIFVRQMLSAANKTQFGESMLNGGQAMETFRQMQSERYADIASDSGAFGIAKMIETHLAKMLPAEEAPANGV